MISAKTWNGKITTYAHQKLDGIFLEVRKQYDGKVCVYTRTPINITEDVSSCGWMLPIHERLPVNTTIYGELWVPGRKASYVKSALINNPEKLCFSGFAIDKPDIPWDASLDRIQYYLALWGIRSIDYLVHYNAPTGSRIGSIGLFNRPERLLDELPDGIEGYVLKNGNLCDWWKLKAIKTIDLIVTGLKPGRKGTKYEGCLGAMMVSTIEGIEVASISGMSDKERHDIDESLIGCVCEVRYQYIGDKGRLRHPAFLTWRNDKRPEECTLSQDPELEEYWL